MAWVQVAAAEHLAQQAGEAVVGVIETRVAPDETDDVDDRREDRGDLHRRSGGQELARFLISGGG